MNKESMLWQESVSEHEVLVKCISNAADGEIERVTEKFKLD